MLTISVSNINDPEVDPEVKYAVVSEAEHTCFYCGIKTAAYSETHLQPPSADNTVDQNMGYMHVIKDQDEYRCVCPFCYYTLNIEKCPEPLFIYFPWLSQTKLNYLMIYALGMFKSGLEEHISKQGSKLYHKLTTGYKTPLKDIDPTLTDNPKELTSLLLWLSNEDPIAYQKRKDVLKDVRVIPCSPSRYRGSAQFLDNWATHNLYKDNLLNQWKNIFEEYRDKIA